MFFLLYLYDNEWNVAIMGVFFKSSKKLFFLKSEKLNLFYCCVILNAMKRKTNACRFIFITQV